MQRSVPPRPTGNLPVPVGGLLGRERELATVHALLDTARLVTLTGAGGSGKTHLAQHAAPTADVDTAWWVDLQPVTQPERVPTVVAEVAGISMHGDGHRAALALATGIGAREMLLVLDNCEQVVDAVAELLDVVLPRCPGLRVLATSRIGLEITGEHVVHVNPLPVPVDPTPSTSDLRDHAATALFLDRATALDTATLTTESRQAITAVCARLDGMPLAIELAAARCPVLSPAELLAALDDRFALLTDGRRSRRPDRQRTLEASIAWSVTLLSPDEAALLHRLAVFPAAFDLGAANDVDPSGDGDTLDRVTELVKHSLITATPAPSGRRYRLQESVRAYCLAHTSAEDARTARDAHLRATIGRLQRLARTDGTVDRAVEGVILRAEPWVFEELDDVRAASAHAVAIGDDRAVVELWWPLHLLLSVSDRTGEGARAIAQLDGDLADPQLAVRREIIAVTGAGRISAVANLDAARELVARLREQDVAPPLTRFCALGTLTSHGAWAGRSEPSLARELVALEQEHRHEWGPLPTAAAGAWATRSLDFVGHPSEAYAVALDAIHAAEQLHAPSLVALGHVRACAAALRLGLSAPVLEEHLEAVFDLVPPGWGQLRAWHASTAAAGVMLSWGDGERLDTLLDEVEPFAGAPGGPLHVATRYGRLLACMAGGDAERGLRIADEVLSTLGSGSGDWFATGTRADRAELLRVLGRHDEAVAALAEASEHVTSGTDLTTTILVTATRAALALDADPAAALALATESAAHHLDREHRCWLYLHLLVAARALLSLGRPLDATRVLGVIDGEHEARGQRVWGIHAAEHAAALAACEAALDQQFAAAYAEGRALTWDDAIAWLLRGRGAGSRADRAVSGWSALTPTEVDVALRAANGETTAEVARALFISPNTVKTHLKRVYTKLDVRNRAELASAVPDDVGASHGTSTG